MTNAAITPAPVSRIAPRRTRLPSRKVSATPHTANAMRRTVLLTACGDLTDRVNVILAELGERKGLSASASDVKHDKIASSHSGVPVECFQLLSEHGHAAFAAVAEGKHADLADEAKRSARIVYAVDNMQVSDVLTGRYLAHAGDLGGKPVNSDLKNAWDGLTAHFAAQVANANAVVATVQRKLRQVGKAALKLSSHDRGLSESKLAAFKERRSELLMSMLRDIARNKDVTTGLFVYALRLELLDIDAVPVQGGGLSLTSNPKGPWESIIAWNNIFSLCVPLLPAGELPDNEKVLRARIDTRLFHPYAVDPSMTIPPSLGRVIRPMPEAFRAHASRPTDTLWKQPAKPLTASKAYQSLLTAPDDPTWNVYIRGITDEFK